MAEGRLQPVLSLMALTVHRPDCTIGPEALSIYDPPPILRRPRWSGEVCPNHRPGAARRPALDLWRRSLPALLGSGTGDRQGSTDLQPGQPGRGRPPDRQRARGRGAPAEYDGE